MNVQYKILMRCKTLVNTDPQRRCYDGCHFSSELVWTDWEILEHEIEESALDRRLKFWRELNDYAVSQRGESAKREFRAEQIHKIHERLEVGE